MKIENFIVLRYLKNLRKSKEISDSALVVIIAIAISVIFFISSLSIMNGYILGRMKIQFEVVSFHIIYTNIATIDNVNYILENNASIFIRKSGIPALFSGTAVSECTSAGCGLNKWYWKGLPSFQ